MPIYLLVPGKLSKIDQSDFIKLESFCTAKETVINRKWSRRYRRTYFPMTPQTRVDLQSIKITKMNQNQKTNYPVIIWAKGLNRHFSKEDTQMADRHVKKCSISLAMRQMQIKTTLRYHLTTVIGHQQ